MKNIYLTKNKVCIVDNEDFERVNKFKWRYHSYGYAITVVYSTQCRKDILMHRFIMDAPADKYVDHINHNGLDNRKENLRIATKQQSSINRRKVENLSSIYKGVYWHKQRSKWCARIKANGKIVFLGRFKDEKEAAKVYNLAAIKYFGEFACLNKIEDNK